MPDLERLLSKLNGKERETIELLIKKITSLNWHNLDIKKLKGYRDIFRVRMGKLRIIFTKKEKNVYIFSIERRREDTYKF